VARSLTATTKPSVLNTPQWAADKQQLPLVPMLPSEKLTNGLPQFQFSQMNSFPRFHCFAPSSWQTAFLGSNACSMQQSSFQGIQLQNTYLCHIAWSLWQNSKICFDKVSQTPKHKVSQLITGSITGSYFIKACHTFCILATVSIGGRDQTHSTASR
jgi:hypothetical protein